MTNWRSISIPRRMRALQRDKRGYPVPFIALRDNNNQPIFTANNDVQVARAIKEKRCAICGDKLPKGLWFVGGPVSAFHPDGCYLDSPLHHDCMQYAMRVCPWLAAPKYQHRIDLPGVDLEALPPERRIFLDPTMNPDRPSVFVAVSAQFFGTRQHFPGSPSYLRPKRPYLAIEWWQGGQQLEQEQGIAAAVESVDIATAAELHRLFRPAEATRVKVCGPDGSPHDVEWNSVTAVVLRGQQKTLLTAASTEEVYAVPAATLAKLLRK